MAREFDPETARTILAIERKTWLFPGVKEQRVRADLDVTMTRYYQMVNALIDTELALQIDPATTYRLRHIRDARQRSRSARRGCSTGRYPNLA
jgi:hypothetical protein